MVWRVDWDVPCGVGFVVSFCFFSKCRHFSEEGGVELKNVQLLKLDRNKAGAVVVLPIVPTPGVVLTCQRRVIKTFESTR